MDVLWPDRGTGRRREQPPPGGARRAPRARRGRDRVARRGALPRRRDRRRPVRARRGRCAPGRDAGGLPCGALALRRRAPPGEPLRRLGGDATRRARGARRRARGRSSTRSATRRARFDAAGGRRARSSVASRELAELQALLAAHAPAHARRHGRRRQDAARARARARRRAGVSRRARRSSSSPRSPTRGLVPDAVAAALDVRALSGQELVDAVIDFLAPRTLLLVLDNCEHLLDGDARRSRTRCFAPRRG